MTPWCCYIDQNGQECDRSARWSAKWDDGSPFGEETHACSAHLSRMLPGNTHAVVVELELGAVDALADLVDDNTQTRIANIIDLTLQRPAQMESHPYNLEGRLEGLIHAWLVAGNAETTLGKVLDAARHEEARRICDETKGLAAPPRNIVFSIGRAWRNRLGQPMARDKVAESYRTIWGRLTSAVDALANLVEEEP